MSTEPRRIRKLERPAGNLPLDKAGREKMSQKIVDEVNREYRSTGAYAQHTVVSDLRRVEGFVTLSQLAVARKIQLQLARLWVKHAGVQKPKVGRWMWKEGSRELARVRKVLGLTIA